MGSDQLSEKMLFETQRQAIGRVSAGLANVTSGEDEYQDDTTEREESGETGVEKDEGARRQSQGGRRKRSLLLGSDVGTSRELFQLAGVDFQERKGQD
jgi:hypothetical protein